MSLVSKLVLALGLLTIPYVADAQFVHKKPKSVAHFNYLNVGVSGIATLYQGELDREPSLNAQSPGLSAQIGVPSFTTTFASNEFVAVYSWLNFEGAKETSEGVTKSFKSEINEVKGLWKMDFTNHILPESNVHFNLFFGGGVWMYKMKYFENGNFVEGVGFSKGVNDLGESIIVENNPEQIYFLSTGMELRYEFFNGLNDHDLLRPYIAASFELAHVITPNKYRDEFDNVDNYSQGASQENDMKGTISITVGTGINLSKSRKNSMRRSGSYVIDRQLYTN